MTMIKAILYTRIVMVLRLSVIVYDRRAAVSSIINRKWWIQLLE